MPPGSAQAAKAAQRSQTAGPVGCVELPIPDRVVEEQVGVEAAAEVAGNDMLPGVAKAVDRSQQADCPGAVSGVELGLAGGRVVEQQVGVWPAAELAGHNVAPRVAHAREALQQRQPACAVRGIDLAHPGNGIIEE